MYVCKNDSCVCVCVCAFDQSNFSKHIL